MKDVQEPLTSYLLQLKTAPSLAGDYTSDRLGPSLKTNSSSSLEDQKRPAPLLADAAVVTMTSPAAVVDMDSPVFVPLVVLAVEDVAELAKRRAESSNDVEVVAAERHYHHSMTLLHGCYIRHDHEKKSM